MSNRFTRNIQNVGTIENLPLYTNDQNDLVSTQDMVYVRHNNAYEPILNKGVLGSGLTPEDVDRIKGIIDDKFKGYTEGAIKELNNNEVTDLEQSILNLIGDSLGGLKFDQDGFKTSLNEVLKRLELSEIADVQNLQREIEYAFDENNKSTSKKIDDVKSELSQMIDEKVGQVQTEDNPIISVESDYNVINDNEGQKVQITSYAYANKEIEESDLKIITIDSDNNTKDFPLYPADEIVKENNKNYVYSGTGIINGFGYIGIMYKDKILELNNTGFIYNQDYQKRVEDYQNKINKLEERVEQLENK